MARWLILLVLMVATATVGAQPRQDPTAASHATASSVTTRARDAATVLQRRAAQLEAKRRELTARYARETAAIDRVKQQRSSWRQQRELKDNLATANDTAKQLTAVTAQHARLVVALATARRSLIAAIDAELRTGPMPARLVVLGRMRAQLTPQRPQSRRIARIVLPELELDPLADPEELDEHAAALRDSEQQLLRQIAGLDRQAAALDDVAKLRKQHDRASELSRRDDVQPQRTAREGNSRVSTFGAAEADDGASAPGDGNGGGMGGDGRDPSAVGGFEAEATIVLSEVVDASTLETLARASRTGDPAKRATAAKAARDAVRRRLLQLQKHRQRVEALAKQRRGR